MVESLIVFLVIALLIFPVWAIVRIISLGRENNAIAQKVQELEQEMILLRQSRVVPPSSPMAPASQAAPAAPSIRGPLVATAPASTSADPSAAREGPPASAVVQPSTARELPPAAIPPAPPPVPVIARTSAAPTSTPLQPAPPLRSAIGYAPPEPEPSFFARINWEQFMGAKLFAWLGGLAAFLGAAFFVKYSFEHDLIPPEVRVALGFVFAIGLVIGGLKIRRERYAVTAQTLIATGIVSLYAVTFACNSVYHFPFFGPLATFLLMVLITATAFLLAVRLDARVIAILGMLGGFLTPILLSTGHDNPPGLFGYIALLDAGLIAVALHRRWHFLVPLGAAGTVLMQIGWAAKFLVPAKAVTAMVVCLGFAVLFLLAYFVARRVTERASSEATPRVPREITGAAALMPFVALGFAFAFLNWDAIAVRAGVLLTFALLADACLLVLAWSDDELPKLHLFAGTAVFAFLAAWTASALTNALLPWALAFYLLYAALHTAFPLLLERHRPAAAPTVWSQIFPVLTLTLMLVPLLKLETVSIALWPCVLLVDGLAIAAALFTGSLAAVAAVLLLTLGATAVWILRVPAALAPEPELLLIIAGFAVFFFAAAVFLGRRLQVAGMSSRSAPMFGDTRAQLPAFSALLPFILLVMMTQRLALQNPSPVFGLALLLVVLTLGLSAVLTLEWLPACALVGVAALEYAWQARHFSAAEPAVPLVWYLLFTAVFAVFPWFFRRRFSSATGPWAVSAVAPALQFTLVYRLIGAAWPNDYLGALPAAFALIPLAGLVGILRMPSGSEKARLNQLAWYGGVALLFITLIFPIQFERQWLTVAWALEGTALLWLFHRVPHPGLRGTGVVLLVVAFVRLGLNPAVLEYHARSATPLLNWYLYSYGLVTAALFAGARLIAIPRHQVLGINAPPLLATLGTILAFLLLNIEIADYFSAPGTTVLTFEFSGNFARDMTYTIAWSLFALGLLLTSMWRQLRPGRYAALALLGAAVLKLFFHDLARLDSLYRIGALFGVAVVAIVASFAYQRFLPSHDKSPAPPP